MKRRANFGTPSIIQQMSKASEVWADFDDLMDLNSISKDINVHNHAVVVKRVSIACAAQVVNELHHLKYHKCDLDERLEYWNSLYLELLKL